MIHRFVVRDRKKAEKAHYLMFPVMTEKTAMLQENKCIVFDVDTRATKLDVASIVERDLGVKPVAVNSLVRKGKRKMFKGVRGVRKDRKLAFVRMPHDFKMPDAQVDND